jgi:hypothetical protein
MGSYSIGNWTVASQVQDTISTPKSLPIPDLSYATDFTVTKRGNGEVHLANTTGSGLEPVEYLRYGRSRIADVYATSGLDVPQSMKLKAREGIRDLHEIRYLLKATNSVSGEEVLIPIRGWVVLELPTADFVTPQAITDLLTRVVSATTATGSVDGTLVTNVARGDLDPTA